MQEAGAEVVTVGAKAGETYGSKLGYPVKCDRLLRRRQRRAISTAWWCPAATRPTTSAAIPKPSASCATWTRRASWWRPSATARGCSARPASSRAARATSFFAIKDDVINAGAAWEDAEVVVDGNLVTSRKPEDLPAFMKASIAVLTGAPVAA